MYLVLHINSDPYCGGDYTWCKNLKEVRDTIKLWNSHIYYIYNMSNKKDIKYKFKHEMLKYYSYY